MKGDINLLPEEIMSTTSYERPSSGSGVIKLVIGLILVGVVVGCSILAPFLHIKMLERELAQLEKEIASEKYAEVKKVNADLASIDGVLAKKKTVLNQIDSTSYPINDIFVALKNAEPVGCTLTNIEFKNNKLKLTGIAKDNFVIAEFVSAIQRLSFLTLDSEVNVQNGNIFSFTLRVGGKDGN